MTEDSIRLEEIFHQALKTLPQERAAYLDQTCGDFPALRAQVESLLLAHEQSCNFLNLSEDGQTANLRSTVAPALREGPSTKIGAYKLLQLVGEGGFGTVYMAEQEHPVRRRVALKIIKLGMDTKAVIARFEAERQALAMMDHPGIARVLDAGSTETGRPFFVMELVKGDPITEYSDKNNLSIPQRLALFVQVCQAVQHAHQKGLIHRDIKPTNILVSTLDDRPVAKVIDFGIAKATQARLTEKTLFTEFRQFIGTPQYMSPEQAEGSLDVDTRSDVYSLGVLLYELLAGTTPFVVSQLLRAGYEEMQRIIREVEPPRPSTHLSTIAAETLSTVTQHRQSDPKRLGQVLSGDLDWIVMRCLEKDRTRRYATASGLAEDIGRYLSDEPVQARPPAFTYRLRKFVRRNKVGALTATAIAAALLLGMGLAAIGLVQARQQTQIARSAAREQSRQRQLADHERELATTAAERATQVQQFLQDMLGSINPDTDKGAAITVQEVLDRAGGKVETSFADQPDIRAVLHETIGRTYFGLQLYPPAIHHLQMAVDLRRRYLPDEPLELAGALFSLADSFTPDLEHHLAQRGMALLDCREAVALFATRLPETDARLTQARALEAQLAGQAATSGQITPDVWAATALPIMLTLTNDQVARLPHEWARAITEARQLRDAGDIAGARAALKRGHGAAIAKIRDLCSARQVDAARQYIRQFYTPLLEVPLVRRLVPIALIGETWPLNNQGADMLVSESFLREAVLVGHDLWGHDHPYIAEALSDLSKLLRREGRFGEAESLAREALEMRRKLLGNESPDTVESLNGLIDVLQSEGKITEAQDLRRQGAVETTEDSTATQP
jgi:eukaryotic-like serine/threonine-protein kinase